ncbi:Bacitracin export permease protein BceB [Paenibacillus allorhizoplanae]|uniref:Bacitracin export permease protein BceB n=1 Tax=Paenibacillus allorhizoplanae TaxID=2905648 RepID=A0ABM9D0F8_9BACL|nr:ABC transporter permease [Paenibacillus allorhizoplanae]CAH1230881.1 Bacitracin export permease protein BceB [Paenibacillus allorhizoplanae]
MRINQLILQNLKANIKHYYLYVLALMFSVALYFAFVTLQYDPALDATKGSIKGAAALKSASVLLIAIVAIFNLYANNIFVKRRSKEIGLLQLIGMTKGKIFRILSTENFILYFGSLVVGTFIGFSVSKLILMVLLQITGVKADATLHFSVQAFIQTIVVFSAVYLLILLVNYLFIQRQTILSLFHVATSTQAKVKQMSKAEAILGFIGLCLVLLGYYVSSKLFSGSIMTAPALLSSMLFILASVIIGTYLFYKGSVRLILNGIRKRKNGYLNVQEVLSLASIMYRMKSNALLLMVITTVSALAIGLLSLSYITYYSVEKTAERNLPAHFAVTERQDAERFTKALDAGGIKHRETTIEVIQIKGDFSQVLDMRNELYMSLDAGQMAVISDAATESIDVTADQTFFTGANDEMQKFLRFKPKGLVQLSTQNTVIPLTYSGIEEQSYISRRFSMGNLPVAVVDDSVFQRLKQDLDPRIQGKSSLYLGIDIVNEKEREKANQLFHEVEFDEQASHESRQDMASEAKNRMGLMMFIVGFLGLTFLITSGCILYFKQMDESEDEKSSYTILRKLGFTQADLLNGIKVKQLFNFGIPLVVGLVHSYFAIQSGWFLFGTELWTPMMIVMGLYTALYSVFGVLSVQHYRKVIKRAL